MRLWRPIAGVTIIPPLPLRLKPSGHEGTVHPLPEGACGAEDDKGEQAGRNTRDVEEHHRYCAFGACVWHFRRRVAVVVLLGSDLEYDIRDFEYASSCDKWSEQRNIDKR